MSLNLYEMQALLCPQVVKGVDEPVSLCTRVLTHIDTYALVIIILALTTPPGTPLIFSS